MEQCSAASAAVAASSASTRHAHRLLLSGSSVGLILSLAFVLCAFTTLPVCAGEAVATDIPADAVDLASAKDEKPEWSYADPESGPLVWGSIVGTDGIGSSQQLFVLRVFLTPGQNFLGKPWVYICYGTGHGDPAAYRPR
jgi:hypothetical protein